MEDEVITIDLDKKYTGQALEKYAPKSEGDSVDVTISSKYSLDDAIKILGQEGYKIISMKPKSGRLEEFFLKSTKK